VISVDGRTRGTEHVVDGFGSLRDEALCVAMVEIDPSAQDTAATARDDEQHGNDVDFWIRDEGLREKRVCGPVWRCFVDGCMFSIVR